MYQTLPDDSVYFWGARGIHVVDIIRLILMTADFKYWMSKWVKKKHHKSNIELAFFFPSGFS